MYAILGGKIERHPKSHKIVNIRLFYCMILLFAYKSFTLYPDSSSPYYFTI